MGIGQGFTVKGKEVKGRTGSSRKVVDILSNHCSPAREGHRAWREAAWRRRWSGWPRRTPTPSFGRC